MTPQRPQIPQTLRTLRRLRTPRTLQIPRQTRFGPSCRPGRPATAAATQLLRKRIIRICDVITTPVLSAPPAHPSPAQARRDDTAAKPRAAAADQCQLVLCQGPSMRNRIESLPQCQAPIPRMKSARPLPSRSTCLRTPSCPPGVAWLQLPPLCLLLQVRLDGLGR